MGSSSKKTTLSRIINDDAEVASTPTKAKRPLKVPEAKIESSDEETTKA